MLLSDGRPDRLIDGFGTDYGPAYDPAFFATVEQFRNDSPEKCGAALVRQALCGACITRRSPICHRDLLIEERRHLLGCLQPASGCTPTSPIDPGGENGLLLR